MTPSTFNSFTVSFDNAEFDRQAKLLYALVVAGKSANFADKALREFLRYISIDCGLLADHLYAGLPFDMLRQLQSRPDIIARSLRQAKTGNYTKLNKAIADILAMKALNLETATPEQLEKIHGMGPKSSRFFIVWTRPNAPYAVLDTHVLRWMAFQGYTVPQATPQNRKMYACIEQLFLAEAKKRGKTPRQLDMEIWEAGAGRTQEKAI
jgi:endonuclease III